MEMLGFRTRLTVARTMVVATFFCWWMGGCGWRSQRSASRYFGRMFRLDFYGFRHVSHHIDSWGTRDPRATSAKQSSHGEGTRQCEGQICRAKLIERIGCGRAKPDQLPQRVLHRIAAKRARPAPPLPAAKFSSLH